jgi:hypothetical protein
VVFYYSGHARASALNLGDEELPLGDLRARLLSERRDLAREGRGPDG